MSYTALAVVGVAFSLLVDLALLRTNLVRRKIFWVSYAIVLVFQLVINGVLTGRRVVTYSAADIVGGATPRLFGDGRFAYAPVEDLLFGFALVSQTLSWWVWWGRHGIDPTRADPKRGERNQAGRKRVSR